MIKKIFYTLSLMSSLFGASGEHLFVVSGVVVNTDSSHKVKEFVKMIEKKSGYRLKPFYVDSYARLSEVLREHPDALAWTCGAPFVEDHIKDKQQLIAVPLFNHKPTYSSFVIARKSDARAIIDDFKGGVFAYSDLRSNSGYLALSVYLKHRDFDMKEFFRVQINTKIHEKSIEAVYRGLGDVAAIDEYVWVAYTKLHPELLQKLHVVLKMGPFPFTPIVAGSGVSKKIIAKIQSALTKMTQEELSLFKKDFGLDGFVLKKASFYEPIKQNLIYMGIIEAPQRVQR